MTGVPLGERESQILEFKRRDALKNPKKVAEGVAAFLNSEGGDLYIGVREEKERGVAVEGVEDADFEARKLHDSLLGGIEPRPGSDDLRIEVIEDPQGAVLRIQVSTGAYPPYAASGRYFVRVGASRRRMTREELADAFSAAAGVELPGARARRILMADRHEIQADDRDWFWIAIQPAREVEIDVAGVDLELLTDPEAIGMSPGSPSFHVPFEPRLEQGRLVAHAIPGHELVKETVIRSDGGIRFRAVLGFLHAGSAGAPHPRIDPDVLIGVSRSLLALSRPVLEGSLTADDLLLIDLALFGIGDDEATLLPDRWHRPRPGQEIRFLEPGEDFVSSKPLELTLGEIEESPDRSVVRLLRELYEAFGLREEAIPVSVARPAAPSREPLERP